MICPNCNSNNLDFAHYCVNCGKQLPNLMPIETPRSKAIAILSWISLLFPLISINDIVIFIGLGFAVIVLINVVLLKFQKVSYRHLNLSMAFAISVIIIQLIWYIFFHFVLPYL